MEDLRTRSTHDANAAPKPAAEAYNPYLAARREWDERYGHLITRERNWRLMALLCGLTTLSPLAA
jgi:type IV secretion system protein VirB5